MTQHSITRAFSVTNTNSMQNTKCQNLYKHAGFIKNRHLSTNSKLGNPEDFIPFIRERDSIGRLIHKTHDFNDADFQTTRIGQEGPITARRFSPLTNRELMTSRTNDLQVTTKMGKLCLAKI